jgi:hypothetical protein
MFVVLHHTGAWSEYRCELFGVFDAKEKAEKAIDDLLIDRVKKLKINIQNIIAFEESMPEKKQDKNWIKRNKRTLCRIEKGKFNFEEEKRSFEILHVPLNRARQYTSDQYDYCTPTNERETPVKNKDDEEYDIDIGEFKFGSCIWENDSDSDDESEDDK